MEETLHIFGEYGILFLGCIAIIAYLFIVGLSLNSLFNAKNNKKKLLLREERDQILAQEHEKYLNEVTESGVPKWVLEYYPEPPPKEAETDKQ